MQRTSCEMLSWMKHKLESRLSGEISITSDTQMIPPLWQRVKKTTSLNSLFHQLWDGFEDVSVKIIVQ